MFSEAIGICPVLLSATACLLFIDLFGIYVFCSNIYMLFMFCLLFVRIYFLCCHSLMSFTVLYSLPDITKYTKTCVKRSLKNRQNKGLKDKW